MKKLDFMLKIKCNWRKNIIKMNQKIKELNPEKLNCKFLGSILNDDELFKIAYKYIRNVSIVSFKKMNYFKNKDTKHFTILNSYRWE